MHVLPFPAFAHNRPVPLIDFVDTMMGIYPQGEALLQTQRALISDLAKGSISFCHMDLHDMNIMVKEGRLAGILDWICGLVHDLNGDVCDGPPDVHACDHSWCGRDRFRLSNVRSLGYEDSGRELADTIAFKLELLSKGYHAERRRLREAQPKIARPQVTQSSLSPGGKVKRMKKPRRMDRLLHYHR